MTPDFQPPTFDQYSYPSDELLDYISRLSPLEHDPFEIAEYINECWHWNNMSRWINRNNHEGCWTISTGGWSGNESIISELRKSLWWMCYWYREERGGHFWFKIKRLEK